MASQGMARPVQAISRAVSTHKEKNAYCAFVSGMRQRQADFRSVLLPEICHFRARSYRGEDEGVPFIGISSSEEGYATAVCRRSTVGRSGILTRTTQGNGCICTAVFAMTANCLIRDAREAVPMKRGLAIMASRVANARSRRGRRDIALTHVLASVSNLARRGRVRSEVFDEEAALSASRQGENGVA